jgi:hypothetical protein
MNMPRHERRNPKQEAILQYLRALGVGLLIVTALILCDIIGRLFF